MRSSEQLFEQRPEPNRWQRIRLGSSTKWALASGLCVIAVLLMPMIFPRFLHG